MFPSEVVSVFTIAVSLLGSWLVARWTVHAERVSGAQTTAVDRLLPSIARLRELMHESSVRDVEAEDVATAINKFESLCLQHSAALPSGIRSVRRDVRAAVGNYFGGASLAAVDARMASFPVTEPHPYWKDISVSYLEYVMARLQQSLSQPKTLPMQHFSAWRCDEGDSLRS